MKDHRTLLSVLAICLVCLPSLAPRLAGAVPTQAAGPVLTIGAPTANVRSGPGVAYPPVGLARKGEQFPITGRIAGNAWWQVTFKGKPAWIAASVASVSADATSAPIVTQIPPPPARSKTANARPRLPRRAPGGSSSPRDAARRRTSPCWTSPRARYQCLRPTVASRTFATMGTSCSRPMAAAGRTSSRCSPTAAS